MNRQIESRLLKPSYPVLPSSPLPENSELNANQPHQTFSEFTGRGGEGPKHSSANVSGKALAAGICITTNQNAKPSQSETSASASPKTKSIPLTPSPQKFGVSLIKWQMGMLRIFGERGAIDARAVGFLASVSRVEVSL